VTGIVTDRFGEEESERIRHLEADLRLLGPVRVDQTFTMRLRDASDDQIRPGVPWEAVERARIFPVTGPVGVVDAVAGDAIGIVVREIRPAPVGHTWTRPGLGFGNPGWFAVRRFQVGPSISDDAGIVVPPALHLGALGVLPDASMAPSTLDSHGGNLDVPFLGAGSVLWVRAHVDGAGIFAGDAHAGMGDGEVAGTGVEVHAEVDLSVITVDSWAPSSPVVFDGERAWVIGIGEDLNAALAVALQIVVGAVAERLGESREQAYLIASLLLAVRVCQVVNARTSVAVSLRGDLAECLIPAEVAELSRRAASARSKGPEQV
jgi:amidase